VYSFKSLFLFFSVLLFTAAAQLQWGGARWEGVRWAAQVESNAALTSLGDDARYIRHQIEQAPYSLRLLWFDFRSGMLAVRADAAVESQLAVDQIPRYLQER
jgi:hypothetical protein